MCLKVCGITSVEDAQMCVTAGVDAIGVNFWPGSPRRCDERIAADIVAAVNGHVTVVGVFVDAPIAEIRRVLVRTGIEWAQLHGDEPADVLEALLPTAFKAVRVRDEASVRVAQACPGDRLLIDASVDGLVGGTGTLADWTLARRIAESRPVILAGGLTAENVGEAFAAVHPFGVDVASGVERAPGQKDPVKVRAFVHAVRAAQRAS